LKFDLKFHTHILISKGETVREQAPHPTTDPLNWKGSRSPHPKKPRDTLDTPEPTSLSHQSSLSKFFEIRIGIPGDLNNLEFNSNIGKSVMRVGGSKFKTIQQKKVTYSP
jgi:hypothetical protein